MFRILSINLHGLNWSIVWFNFNSTRNYKNHVPFFSLLKLKSNFIIKQQPRLITDETKWNKLLKKIEIVSKEYLPKRPMSIRVYAQSYDLLFFTVSTIVNWVQKINGYDFKTVSPYKSWYEIVYTVCHYYTLN